VKVALGLRAHSGWAALVALGAARAGEAALVDRRRLSLVPDGESWAKAPYHAAEDLDPDDARTLVERAIASARRLAVQEVRAAAKRAREAGHDVAACAVLVSDPMPAWSVAEILAVHFRMHRAEGVLFREALALAAGSCGLPLVALREKDLPDPAPQALVALGRSAGPPWGKDQKVAALAAWLALRPAPRG